MLSSSADGGGGSDNRDALYFKIMLKACTAVNESSVVVEILDFSWMDEA